MSFIPLSFIFSCKSQASFTSSNLVYFLPFRQKFLMFLLSSSTDTINCKSSSAWTARDDDYDVNCLNEEAEWIIWDFKMELNSIWNFFSIKAIKLEAFFASKSTEYSEMNTKVREPGFCFGFSLVLFQNNRFWMVSLVSL